MKAQPPEYWLSEFRARMVSFGSNTPSDNLPVSIKLGVDSGCFCKSCCPEGHRLISDYLRLHPFVDGQIEEHESGPEILTYIQLAAGVSSLAAAVVSLIVAIVQARSVGAKKGDRRGHPFKLIIRRINEGQGFEEQIVMEIPADVSVDAEEIASRLVEHADQIREPIKTKKAAKRKKKR